VDKELLEHIWSSGTQQTYKKSPEIPHDHGIPTPKRGLYSIVPVRLKVAEERKGERKRYSLDFEKVCLSDSDLQYPLEKDMKVNSWNEWIVQVLRSTLDACTASQTPVMPPVSSEVLPSITSQ
jgi:hypothetical protein